MAEKDWNLYFAEQMAIRNKERAKKLEEGKTAAKNTKKEPFDEVRFKALYKEIYPDDVDKHTPWDTLIKEAEYDYYVSNKDKMTMKDLILHIQLQDGYA